MFFTTCRDYLITKITASGIKTKPYTTMKKLSASYEAHVGAVLFDKETYDRSGAKKSYTDQEGGRHKRSKVFSRESSFDVIIGDADPDQVEAIFEAFMTGLDRGIYIDGNYVYIEPGEAEWADDEDSILKSKMAVKISIKFIGGIYKDTDLSKLSDIEIADVSGGKE